MYVNLKLSGVKIMPNNVAVKLPDGTIISLSDLPPITTKRWVASTKAAVVKVYIAGLIEKDEVLERYGLSAEEFQSWIELYREGGQKALKITKRPKK